MDERRLVRVSKYLALHLRHAPERIGLALDPNGWADVRELLRLADAHGFALTGAELREAVERNDKARFELAGGRIRARQGHTVEVDLGLEPAVPPDVLFHGTNAAALPAIRERGLLPRGRHHVHLSPDQATARRVGGRRGAPVVLTVDAAAMARDGHVFLVSSNGVWLTGAVPPAYQRQ